MVRAARAALAKGRPLVIFPQGTRTLPATLGSNPKPYQPGVAALYGELDVPVVPVALNSGLFWGRRAFRKYPGRIIVEFLPPIAPGLAKRAFLARLEEAIETATNRLEKPEFREQIAPPRV
jgi:1-acyl-sn-glycerol-3-phosphate acyltransferase